MAKLSRFLKIYTGAIILVFILVFLQSLSQLYLPTLMAKIVDIGIVQGDTNYILRIGFFMLIIAAGGVISTIAASFLSAKIGSGFGKNVREQVFSRVESFTLHEFDKIGTASLITRSTNDITQVERVLMLILRIMISAPMMGIGGIIMAVSKDLKLSLIIVIVIPIISIVIIYIAKKGMPLFKAIQIKLDKLNLVSREGLTGIRVIRAFNRINHEQRRFDEANTDLTNTAIKINQIMAAVMPIMMLIMNFATIAIIWFGGIRIDDGSMQVGDMMAFIQYIMLIMFSLIMVSMMFVMVPRASASAVRINEVLDTIPEINDSQQPKNPTTQRGFIEFKKVTFSYHGAEKPALSNISFSARPGEMTAIIGGTGSGKSTLISLIPRFYDISSGKILIEGVNVHEIPQKSLRAKIGLVPQKSVLFTGTISENIRFGKDDASDNEVLHAAKTAQAIEFISKMPDGFASVIAQGGNNLSGGQKQRLAIARALVRKPDIYIFDDSFSALDFKTDAKLRQMLKEETKNSTVLIVAQRISTIMDADQIIVLDQGEIVGIGKHKDLLNTCEVYREIVSSQLSEEELA
ncbi:MAG: multidrug ABC transporter ATP-binding protein [Clostridiaceae bacterium BRH_c20a]|nr:MAG: multidrug ABC transporter ATP-binding protein [Clostridiaceae bacterium BRH_c20a]